jgi:hypothetical protein
MNMVSAAARHSFTLILHVEMVMKS